MVANGAAAEIAAQEAMMARVAFIVEDLMFGFGGKMLNVK